MDQARGSKHPGRNLQTNALRVDHRYATVFTTRPECDLQFLSVKWVERVVHLDRGTYGLMSALAGIRTSMC